MRILFYLPKSIRVGGGGEIWLQEVSNRLLRKGHNISIFALNYAPNIRLRDLELKKGIQYSEYHFLKPPRGYAIPSPNALDKLVELINSSDVLYFFTPHIPNELILKIIKVRLKRPMISGFHSHPENGGLLNRMLLRFSLKIFVAFHVLNNYTYNILIRWGCDYVYKIPNGVNTQRFRLCECPSGSRPFNVLFTGRLTEDKGVDDLMKIIRYVNEKLKIQDIKFTIAGSGPLEDTVKTVAQKYKNVDYLGFVNPEVISKIYMNANLFLIPSKTEGMPSSLLEAQSCGLPVIGSKIPGISDVVVNGETGCLVNVGDVRGFAEAIKKYYELWRASPEEYYNMNKAIREHIIRNYDWNIIIDRLEVMFKSLIT